MAAFAVDVRRAVSGVSAVLRAVGGPSALPPSPIQNLAVMRPFLPLVVTRQRRRAGRPQSLHGAFHSRAGVRLFGPCFRRCRRITRGSVQVPWAGSRMAVASPASTPDSRPVTMRPLSPPDPRHPSARQPRRTQRGSSPGQRVSPDPPRATVLASPAPAARIVCPAQPIAPAKLSR